MGKALVWIVNTAVVVGCAAMTIGATVSYQAGTSNLASWWIGLHLGDAPQWLQSKTTDQGVIVVALAFAVIWFVPQVYGKLKTSMSEGSDKQGGGQSYGILIRGSRNVVHGTRAFGPDGGIMVEGADNALVNVTSVATGKKAESDGDKGGGEK